MLMISSELILVMYSPWIVSDELWERIEPLLPVRPASKKLFLYERLPEHHEAMVRWAMIQTTSKRLT